jgi:hypothetical protein
MNVLQFVSSRDGSLSMTKLAGCTFHLLLALTVAWVTWRAQDFRIDMWTFYAAAALGHVGFDKSMAVMQDLKTKRLEMESSLPQPEVVINQVKTQ